MSMDHSKSHRIEIPALEPILSSALSIALSAAVPLWQEELRHRAWAEIQVRLPGLYQLIAEHGDNLLYPAKKKGETARVFNACAEAIAALSFAPGGVRAFGEHWTARHPDLAYDGDQV